MSLLSIKNGFFWNNPKAHYGCRLRETQWVNQLKNLWEFLLHFESPQFKPNFFADYYHQLWHL